MSEDGCDVPGNDHGRSSGWVGAMGIATVCIFVACLAFVLAAASFGALSLPIIGIGLATGLLGKSRWVRWPSFSAVGSILAMYLFLVLSGR